MSQRSLSGDRWQRRRAVWRRSGLRLALVGWSRSSWSRRSVYLWFLAFWGFNYRRVPLEQKLAFDAGRISREPYASIARRRASR